VTKLSLKFIQPVIIMIVPLITRKISESYLSPATASQQKYFYLFLSAILLILWACYAHHFNPPIFPLDDGYIILHNAKLIHLGFDPNYFGSSPLDGTTSAIYLTFIALLLFWISPLWALITAGWLGTICYALLLSRLAFMYSASILQTILICTIGLLTGFVTFQFFNGLETVIAFAAITATLTTNTGIDTPAKRICRNLLCGSLPFLRPELSFFSLLIFFYQGWCYRQQYNLSTTICRMCVDICLMFIAALPWVLWYWIDTGLPFPRTLLAKKYFFAEWYLPLDVKAASFFHSISRFSSSVGYLGLPGMLLLLLLTPLGRVCFIFIFIFLVTYFINAPEDLSDNLFRYTYLLLPVLLFGIISCIRHQKKMIVCAANGLMIFLSVFAILFFPLSWSLYLEESYKLNTAVTTLASWCQENFPKHATILIHDAGYLAYATSFHLIDMVGLKTPSVIPYEKKFTYPSAGINRGEAIAKIIEVNHPQYLIDLPSWETRFNVTEGLSQWGLQLELLKRFPRGYQIYRIRGQKKEKPETKSYP
jgi:hypothetical protein